MAAQQLRIPTTSWRCLATHGVPAAGGTLPRSVVSVVFSRMGSGSNRRHGRTVSAGRAISSTVTSGCCWPAQVPDQLNHAPDWTNKCAGPEDHHLVFP